MAAPITSATRKIEKFVESFPIKTSAVGGCVRAVIRRLHRLEERMTPRLIWRHSVRQKFSGNDDDAVRKPAGSSLKICQPEPVPSGPVSYLSVAETLRTLPAGARERNLALQGGQR